MTRTCSQARLTDPAVIGRKTRDEAAILPSTSLTKSLTSRPSQQFISDINLSSVDPMYTQPIRDDFYAFPLSSCGVVRHSLPL